MSAAGLTAIMPAAIAPPAANYAHGVLITGATGWLHTAGVVPVRPDGTVPETLLAQAETVWSNIAAILLDAQMSPANIVSATTYVVTTAGTDLSGVMAVRDAMLNGRRIASTLLSVSALAQPAWLLEIAVVAAL